VLIVADEFHAMQMLASHLEADTKVHTRNIGQLEMPASLASYRAVRVYLHGELQGKQKLVQLSAHRVAGAAFCGLWLYALRSGDVPGGESGGGKSGSDEGCDVRPEDGVQRRG